MQFSPCKVIPRSIGVPPPKDFSHMPTQILLEGNAPPPPPTMPKMAEVHQ